MKQLIYLFLVFIQIVPVGYAAPTFIMKSESSVSETESSDQQGHIRTAVNTSFDFGSIYNPKERNFIEVLISQKIELKTRSGMDGADSNLEVIAWTKNNGKYEKKLWVIRDQGDEGRKWGDFYRTAAHGACGAETLYRAYNFSTGNYVFAFSTDPVSVDVPNTKIKRNISYVSANVVTSGCMRSTFSPNGIGILTLTDDHKTIDRIILESDDGELAWSPKLFLIDKKNTKGTSKISIWTSNGINSPDAVKDFSVKVFFYDGVEVNIPVNKDRFDIQNATLPRKIGIRRIATN